MDDNHTSLNFVEQPSSNVERCRIFQYKINIQGDSLARGTKLLSIKIMLLILKETIFSINYQQVLFCIVPGMCI